MIRLLAALAASAAALLLPAAPAAAQARIAWEGAVRAEVAVLPGWRDAGRSRHMAALHVRLAPGWKTYWRAPGEGGIPPVLTLDNAQNIEGFAMHWPAPIMFLTAGMKTVGYRDEVILPLELALHDDRAPARLRGHLELGICEEICIPVRVSIDADLPAGTGGRDPRIVAALASRPVPAREQGLVQATCTMAPGRRGLEVTARLDMPALPGGGEFVVFETGNPDHWVGQAKASREGRNLTARAEIVAMSGGGALVERGALTITVIGTRMAVEVRGCPAP